ncbi:sigma-70 family RNA polymerase sigma factor [Romboutsia sp.]|uniref:sigma-70 family RNA polymerase sigma factor n=1 Tax=Romboutsia sp. TaxID=1965302 RepID=UPI002C15CAFF|nr:sigma-70 family RNA polymerase sigma factor [Romboutsia sp.]HSQ90425.1 sigma-70 family RNA polymerase sigma factor [Romboutsia sp.]
MISDIKLLNLLHNQPDKGLELMMEAYMGLIYTIVYNQLSNILPNEDIEECVSDVFFYVFNYKDKIDLEKGTIKALLAVVAKRKAIDLYRRNKKSKAVEIPIESMNENIFDKFDSVSDSVSTDERNNFLIKAIKSLGEPDSEIIIRKYYFKESSKDISKVLGLKVNTIDKKASRCMGKLKNILRGVL